MLPSTFRALRALERINIAGVGLALAAATAAVFSANWSGDHRIALYTGVPTLVIGTLWARLLRWPKTLGKGTFRAAWLLSAPLAAANAGVALAIVLTAEHSYFTFGRVLAGLLAGATFGVIIWGPALVLTLLCFGLPISWAQQAARKGLAGQERGEFVVGAATFIVATAALALTFAATGPGYAPSLAALAFTRSAALLAALCAGAAMAVSASRARRRQAFVAEVEAGRVERFRIDLSDEGKVLVRLGVRGHDYRVADLEEEFVVLDGEGAAARRA